MKINHADLWKEGKYIDMWSIPHVLCGVVLAGVLNWIGIDFVPNIILSTLIMIWWEFFELIFLGVHEFTTNKIMDVVTGVIGFFVTYYFISISSIKIVFPYIIIVTIIWLLLNAWGLYAFKTRTDSNNIVS